MKLSLFPTHEDIRDAYQQREEAGLALFDVLMGIKGIAKGYRLLMSKLSKHAVITLIFLALFSIGPTSSHGESTPLVITLNGDQWAWTDGTPSLQQLTHSGVNRDGVLSTDGKTIAYRSLAKSIMQSGGMQGGDGGVPTDMWLLNLATDILQMITDAPTSQPNF